MPEKNQPSSEKVSEKKSAEKAGAEKKSAEKAAAESSSAEKTAASAGKPEGKLARAVLPTPPLPSDKPEKKEPKAPEGGEEKSAGESPASEVLAARSKKDLAADMEDKRLRDNIGKQHQREYISPEHIKRSRFSLRSWLLGNPVRLIAVSFAFTIFLGSLLLCLPGASASGEATDYSTALFTSTSAVCVTGLVLQDTGTYWSPFGHAVIITLIQIGGIGLITIVAAFFSITRKKINLKALRAVQDSLGSDSAKEVYRLVRHVLAVTFSVEFLGGLILSLRYLKYMPAGRAFYAGMFQGVSAFCNAGFDVLGPEFGRYASLSGLQQDPVILLTTAFLLTFGGLGFVVWMDLWARRHEKRLQFHSRTVLLLTGIILLTGTIGFMLLEWRNTGEQALGTLPLQQKPLAAFFQAATLRTAGFNSINQANLSDASKLLSCLIMFIGAGPVSTGGGMKVTTCAIVAAAWKSNLRGRPEVDLFRHKITPDVVMRAFAIFFMGVVIALGVTFSLSIIERAALAAGKFSTIDLLFETMSALCTVGVTSLQTENLSFWSRIPLILAMYIGRIGPFSFALLISLRSREPENAVLPEGRTFVG